MRVYGNSPEDEHISVSQVNETNSRSNTPRILSPTSPGMYVVFLIHICVLIQTPREIREKSKSYSTNNLKKS